MQGVDRQMLVQTRHRFRSLEIELFDASTSGILLESDYRSKMQRLTQLQQKLASIEALADYQRTPLRGESGTIEFPVLSDCSLMEQRIILASLVETRSMLRVISEESSKVFKQVSDVQKGRGGWIRLVMYLSWQRARIRWVVKQLEIVRAMRQHLEGFIKQFTAANSEHGARGDLVDAFREFESTTSRIAGLKSKLYLDISTNRDQEIWIKKYEEKRRKEAVGHVPPTPAELMLAKAEIESDLVQSSSLALDRLVIASRLQRTLSGEVEATAERSIVPSLEPNLANPFRATLSKKKRISKKMRTHL